MTFLVVISTGRYNVDVLSSPERSSNCSRSGQLPPPPRSVNSPLVTAESPSQRLHPQISCQQRILVRLPIHSSSPNHRQALEMGDGHSKCPSCGASMPASGKTCTSCGKVSIIWRTHPWPTRRSGLLFSRSGYVETTTDLSYSLADMPRLSEHPMPSWLAERRQTVGSDDEE